MESSLGGGEETTQSEEGGGKLRWELNWETRKRDEMTRINIRLETTTLGRLISQTEIVLLAVCVGIADTFLEC